MFDLRDWTTQKHQKYGKVFSWQEMGCCCSTASSPLFALCLWYKHSSLHSKCSRWLSLTTKLRKYECSHKHHLKKGSLWSHDSCPSPHFDLVDGFGWLCQLWPILAPTKHDTCKMVPKHFATPLCEVFGLSATYWTCFVPFIGIQKLFILCEIGENCPRLCGRCIANL